MVHQVVADLACVPHHGDAVFGELVAIPDTGEHQQLRAVDGAGAQHHLATRPDHPPLAAVLEFDPDGRVPSKSTRVAVASVSTVRFVRRKTGLR
jgi:hypothetical protein